MTPAGPAGPAGADGAQGPTGAEGADGEDGRDIEIQNDGATIQWRYAGDMAWTDLVALSEITGPAGTGGSTLAFAQYRFTGIGGLGKAQQLAEDISSTDDSLIRWVGDNENIELAAGHTYFVSYNLSTSAADASYLVVVNPFYGGATIGAQSDVSEQYISHFSYISSSFLVESGGGGNLSFFSGAMGGSPQIEDGSGVTILCIR